MAPKSTKTAVQSVGKILNEAQVSLSTHKKCVKLMLARRHADPDSFLPEICNCILPVLLEYKRDLCAERVVRFVVTFTAARAPGMEEEGDDFCEAFLGFLLNLAAAKDKAVRFRVCQIVAGVLNALAVDAEISDELYERMEDVMLERLRDKMPLVRAQAARALSRLQDGGEAGDFSEDAITKAFITLLSAEKNKDTRKAILGSLAISDYTIPFVVERTRDASEDVRRVAFLAMTSKVPVAAVSIALRATAARRGLADRSPNVRAAAVDMIKRWLDAFEGDVLALLAAVDAETHEDVADAIVAELIACRRIKPAVIAASVAEGTAPGGGLRRAADAPPMTPEAAVYWRVICQSLAAAAGASGSDAATAVGQNQVVSAAVAGEKLDALESALPAEASALLALIASHAKMGAKFVARQLLPLLSLVDLADGATRRGAISLVAAELAAKPAAADDATFDDVAGAVSSHAHGGDGAWERALVATAKMAHGSNAAATASVLEAADALRARDGDDEKAHAQALFLATLLLENLPRNALSTTASEALMETLVRPGVTHESRAVRKEAITCCGLLCVVNGAKPSAECVKILRAALAKDAATVKCAAAKALGDLALIFGPATLDALNGGDGNGAAGAEDSSDFDGDDDDAAAPLERAFLSALDDADAAVDAAAVAAAEERYSSNPSLGDDDLGVDVSGGKIAAEAEAESCVGTAAAEALAKLCLRRGAAAFASAPAVVSKLLRTYFAVDARSRPRLAQCLAVFFPALASGPEDRRRLVSDAALPTLRAAAKQKGVAKVANYLVHLLTACAPVVEMAASIAATAAVSDDVTEDTTSTSASAKTAPGPAATARGEVLIASLLKEALAVTLRPTSLYATTAEKTLSKAYVGALAKVAAHGCVLDGRASSERTALAHASVAVKLCAARVAEKTAAKDLNVASTNVARAMKQLLFAADEETEDDATTTAEDAEEATTAAVMAECEALSRSRELGVADGVSGVALIPTTKAVKAADAKEKETTPPPEEIDATEEEEEEEPAAAKGKAGRAARGSRAALKENFAR